MFIDFCMCTCLDNYIKKRSILGKRFYVEMSDLPSDDLMFCFISRENLDEANKLFNSFFFALISIILDTLLLIPDQIMFLCVGCTSERKNYTYKDYCVIATYIVKVLRNTLIVFYCIVLGGMSIFSNTIICIIAIIFGSVFSMCASSGTDVYPHTTV